MRVVITGAAGSLARDIIPGLLTAGHEVVGFDREEWSQDFIDTVQGMPGVKPRQMDFFVGDIEQTLQDSTVFDNAQALIHLAGIPLEDEWSRILETNIDLTQRIFDRVRSSAISRVVMASSIHAVGFTEVPRERQKLPPEIPFNPNTFYGASKAACEAIARLYVNISQLEVVVLRIASRFPEPLNRRMLSTWLSPKDAARLFSAAVSSALPVPFLTVWGVSNNTRGYFDLDPGYQIGYQPQDNAEEYARRFHGEKSQDLGSLRGEVNPWDLTIGGEFSSPNPPRMKGRENE